MAVFGQYGTIPVDYSADMRNPNGNIDLWPIQFSDYAAGMRKSNVRNDLWHSSILARGGRAVRARRSHDAIDERGRSQRNKIEDQHEYELKFGRIATTNSRLRIMSLVYWRPSAGESFSGSAISDGSEGSGWPPRAVPTPGRSRKFVLSSST